MIRVDAARIDALLDMVGELVIAENMVFENWQESGTSNLESATQLHRVTRQLQDIAMSIRMVPIRGVFRKMRRLVRDLSVKTGKSVELELRGEGTEVDKTLVESISDPLVHLLRNSVDHGIEPEDVRVAAGKPPEGRVFLSAEHHSGEVRIMVRDDGKGLDRDKILRKAQEKGIYHGDGSELSDNDIFDFIFHAGFSTAEQVTAVSGRGVGMDVVRRNLAALKGRIDVTSEPGQGTAFTLRVPLTLAIMDGMLLRVADRVYTIPLNHVHESLPAQATSISQMPDGTERLRLRGHFVPLIRLDREFSVGHSLGRDATVVCIEAGGLTAGLLVDEVMGQQQTVIKALPPLVSSARAVSGCTILGNGRLSLILDANALVDQVRPNFTEVSAA